MISRRTTLLIAELLEKAFRRYHSTSHNRGYYTIDTSAVYDFLFENEYPAWFCNAARQAYGSVSTRPFTDFVLKIHTGESVYAATSSWTWPQREKLGQELIKELAEDIIRRWEAGRDISALGAVAETLSKCQKSLQLDGYVLRGETLLVPEAEVLEVPEETGVLRGLYDELGLLNRETAFHHLALSEEHYLAGRWDDSISNSRKFLEGVLQEVAASHHAAGGNQLPEATYTRPARVRDYLESGGLLESKEKEALSSVYGLLSQTGGHPYMARSDQARLLRHLALTLSQFVMLRLKGSRRGA
jgi:hypothetical protein